MHIWKNTFLEAAFEQANIAEKHGEIPVGAVIVDPKTNQIVAQACNRTERDADPTAHAELLAIRQACAALKSPRLPGLDLYVTLEPCPMCATAIGFARIRRLYFAAYDPKSGGVDHGPRIYQHKSCHHAPDCFGGLQEARAQKQLQDFFQRLRG